MKKSIKDNPKKTRGRPATGKAPLVGVRMPEEFQAEIKAWAKTERIVVGGGFRDSRLGELAIARAEIVLKAENFKVEMLPIHRHPDDAGLMGALHLAPSWIF